MFAPWEAIVTDLPALLAAAAVRERIDQLDVISTDALRSPTELERAFLVLAMLTQAYIWAELPVRPPFLPSGLPLI
jgi:indoleamine 2,3-dioxygenase